MAKETIVEVKTAVVGDELVILQKTNETFAKYYYTEIGRIKFKPKSKD